MLDFGTEAGTEGDKPVLADVGAAPGGGGSGAIPKIILSLAAAAAAADAYLRVSPGALVGRGAGFIPLFATPFEVEGNEA